jgi:hypothetical protein
MAGMGFRDDALDRQRQRRDPLGRLPWPVQLLGLLAVLVLAMGQIALGSGASKLLGAGLLVVVVPPQAVATWASWKLAHGAPG